jgi:PhzF family phenazine biosynthesis protein
VRIFQVDAFTDSIFTGNPATVVLDADGQRDVTLAAIAREYAHAETVFVLAADGADHDVRLRFFNARKEAPFVGHATIAAHAVLLSLGRRREGVLRQLSGTGVIDVTARARRRDGRTRTDIEFRQSVPELDDPLPPHTTLRVAEALRLPAARLHPALPACIARKGSTRLLLPLANAAALDLITPQFADVQTLGRELGADGVFAFAVTLDQHGASTDSRMFCPALGIPEDPVSGNAHAMLAVYLWKRDLLAGRTAFIGRQGLHMARPGRVEVSLDMAGEQPLAVRIAGSAVIVSDGNLAAGN